MAIVPFKLWEDMKRWKEEQIQKPRLPPNPGKMMVQLNFMANLFQGLILLIWSMMSLGIEKAVNLQVGKLLQKV